MKTLSLIGGMMGVWKQIPRNDARFPPLVA